MNVVEEQAETKHLQVTNPLQAASEIFYKPKGVFEALALKDNWSWIPFLLLSAVLFLPPYLYFSLVDFDWWREILVNKQLPDASPAERDNMGSFIQIGQMQWTYALGAALGPIIFHGIIGFYYSFFTRNDEKSVHGFTDWYGAMWWIAMPTLVNSLISLILLSLSEAGGQIETAIIAPLSLAYIFGVSISSQWFDLLVSIRLDFIWSVYLGALLLTTWTNFTFLKSLLIAAIPSLVIWTISLVVLIT